MTGWSREHITEFMEILSTINDADARTGLKLRAVDGEDFASVRDSALDVVIDEHRARKEAGSQSTLFDEGREIVRKDVTSKEEVSREMARRSAKPRIGLSNIPTLMARFLSGSSDSAKLSKEYDVTEANIIAAVYGRTYSRHYVASLSKAIEMLEKSSTYRLSHEHRDDLGKQLGTAVRAWMRSRS
jgi:hypothetical protein